MKETVLIFGSFDMLHRGHRYFLKRSSEYGQRLLVILARDEEIFHFKHRNPAWNFEQRKAALLESGLVDEVIRSDMCHGTFYVLQKQCKVDRIILGDGQEALGAALEEFFQTNGAFRCPVMYIAPHRHKLHSSTQRHQMRLLLAHLALLGALFLWASSWAIGKLMATSGLAAPLAATLRLSLLASFFFLWQLLASSKNALRELKQAPRNPKNRGASPFSMISSGIKAEFALDWPNLRYLLLSGLSFAVYNLCFFYGLNAVFASQGGVLTSVLIPFFLAMLYKHKVHLRPKQIFGLLLGLFSGLVLLDGVAYLQGLFSFDTNNQVPWQSGLFIGTALTWSLITQLGSKIQKSYSLPKYMFYTYLFATLGTSWGWLWYEGGIDWLALLGLVFISSILGTSLYFFALRVLHPYHVASFLFLHPVCILLISWLFLAEPWRLDLSIGSTLAVLALILLNEKNALKQQRSKKGEEHFLPR